MIRAVIALIFILAASMAAAQLAGPVGNNSGPRFNKWDQMGMGLGGTSSTGVAPPTCDGTIDLSTGCVQPMLGGL